MKRPKRVGEPTPIHDVLPSILRGLRGPSSGPLERARKAWAEIVGPVAASRTRVRSLENGQLSVEVGSAALKHDLSTFRQADVLRGLGRQSNRETSLAVARLLQTYLGMDMGLPDGNVAPNSKVAAEAARAVFQWATGRPAPPPPAEAGSAWVTRPVSRPALPGLKKTALPPRTQPPGGGGATWAPR